MIQVEIVVEQQDDGALRVVLCIHDDAGFECAIPMEAAHAHRLAKSLVTAATEIDSGVALLKLAPAGTPS